MVITFKRLGTITYGLPNHILTVTNKIWGILDLAPRVTPSPEIGNDQKSQTLFGSCPLNHMYY